MVNFKTLFHRLEARMRLRLCIMKVSLDVLLSKYSNDVLDLHVLEVHVQQRLCTLFCCWVRIHPLLCFWPVNYTKHNRTKSSMYMNHGYDKTHTQSPLILRRNDISFGHADQYDQIDESRIILNSSLIITTWKASTVKDMSRPKIQKNFWKSKIYGNK